MEKAIKKHAVIFILPTLAAFIIGFIVPFVEGLYLSFCKFTTVGNATFVGISNYTAAIKDTSFTSSFKFTVLFAIVSILLINVLAFGLALLLTQKLKGTNIFRTVFFMPNLIGGIVLGYIWQLLLNGILMNFSRTLTYSSTYGFWGLIILMCWQQIGYMMIIYTTGLNNIPKDLSEAAAIDGAGTWQRFKSITVPMLMPSFTIVFFLTLSKCFMLLDQNVALTDGNFSTRMLAMQILYTTRDGSPPDYGLAQAQAVIFFVLIAAVTLVQVSITSKKEVEL
mgnify:CR=1 FL=1